MNKSLTGGWARDRPVGFVVLSHAHPEQVLRLTATLARMYGDPPIVCHHDLSQSRLDEDRLPGSVRVVRPPVRTSWAKWSVVEAFLRALRLLYEDGGPDWFFLLSGSDYPVAPAARVLDELNSARCDAFIDIHQLERFVPAATLIGNWNPQLSHLEEEWSYREKRRFYLAAQFSLPIVRRRPRWRPGRHTVYLPFNGRTPFNDRFGLFYGEHWFAAKRRAAEALLASSPDHARLQRHLRWRFAPDECYYQTVLANTPGLVLDRDNRRFVEWAGGGAHPVAIDAATLPKALASNAFFARKFAPGSSVLDTLDRQLLQ